MKSKFFAEILIPGLILIMVHCQETTKSRLDTWKSSLDTESPASLDDLARITFHHSYRESKWDPDKKTFFVEYGGSSALTFSKSDEYIPMTKLDLARKTLRTYFYARDLGVEDLQVSLVKPFYIKNASNPDTEIQEFEVYRIRITPNTWNSLSGKDKLDLFETNENDYPEGEFREALEIWMKNWKEELNEFSKIELE